ncbi:MAG: hypothetical protein AAGI17_06700 [Planctomycetota bacterium]
MTDRRRAIGLGCALAAACLCGCGSSPDDAAAATPVAQDLAPQENPTRIAGLAMTRLAFAAPVGRLPFVVRELEAEERLRPAEELAWLQDAGFRAYWLDLGTSDELLALAPPAAGLDRGWSTGLTLWSQLAEGAPVGGGQLAAGDGATEVPPGRARLLTRTWIEPTIADDGTATDRLRLEFRLAWLETRSAIERSIAELDRVSLGRLIGAEPIDLAIDPGVALLLVVDDPEADWDDLALKHERGEDRPRPVEPIIVDDADEPVGPGQIQTDAPAAGAEVAPETQTGAPSGPPEIGPTRPSLPTFAEALFGSPRDGARPALILTAATSRPAATSTPSVLRNRAPGVQSP